MQIVDWHLGAGNSGDLWQSVAEEDNLVDPQFKMRLPADRELRARILRLLSRYRLTQQGDLVTASAPPAVMATLGAIFGESSSAVHLDDLNDICDRCWEGPTVGGYHGYQSLGDDLTIFAAANPGRAERVTIGRSAEGREIWALRIGPSSGHAAKKLLLVGCHHACEWISVEVPLLLAQAVCASPQTSDGDLFADVELWTVPMLNPDGHYFSENYSRIWRKSRRAFVSPFGFACFGVDLNRNYPVGFGGGVSGANDATVETYSGPEPFSEPETTALRALCCEQRFSGILSFHAYGNEILYPWAYKPLDLRDSEIADVRATALAMGAAIQRRGTAYSVLQSYKHYDVGVGGDFCDWAFEQFGKIALTVELGPAGSEMQLPSSMIATVVEEFWPGFLKFLEHVE